MARGRERNRKGTAPHPTVEGAGASDTPTTSVAPMAIQVGDRPTEQGHEWKVVTHPTVFQGGKGLRACIRPPGVPETERAAIWPVHERVEIGRGLS
jgi:hypothetical protein